MQKVKDVDCIVIAVAHKEFKNMSVNDFKKLYKNCNNSEKILIDVKGIYTINDLKNSGILYWRL